MCFLLHVFLYVAIFTLINILPWYWLSVSLTHKSFIFFKCQINVLCLSIRLGWNEMKIIDFNFYFFSSFFLFFFWYDMTDFWYFIIWLISWTHARFIYISWLTLKQTSAISLEIMLISVFFSSFQIAQLRQLLLVNFFYRFKCSLSEVSVSFFSQHLEISLFS